ncbi:MAG TPA: hypothetical protein VGW76_12645, partial [Pyrinomonadaceae bacterium]|nr:hypothetical protein [Pyrinomonadaceae bacterium]
DAQVTLGRIELGCHGKGVGQFLMVRQLDLPEKCFSGKNEDGQHRALLFWGALTFQRFGRSRPVAITAG